MRTQRLAVIDDAWRSTDRQEPQLWIAASAAPLAWVGSLVGLPLLAALVITVLGGIVAGLRLRELQRTGDLTWQRTWFLAEAGVTMSIVSTLLIAIAAV